MTRKSIVLTNSETEEKRKKVVDKLHKCLEDQIYIKNEANLEIKFQVGTKIDRNKNGTEEEHLSWAREMIYFCDLDEEKTEINFQEPLLSNGKKLVHKEFYNDIPYDILYERLFIKKNPGSAIMFPEFADNLLYFYKIKYPYKDNWKKEFLEDDCLSEEEKERTLGKIITCYKNHKCTAKCEETRLHQSKRASTTNIKDKGKIVFADYLTSIVGFDTLYLWKYFIEGKEHVVKFFSKEAYEVTPIKRRIFLESQTSCDRYEAKEIRDLFTEAVVKGRKMGLEHTNYNLVCEKLDMVKSVIDSFSETKTTVKKEDFPRKIYWNETKQTFHFISTVAKKAIKISNETKEPIFLIDVENLLEKIGAEKTKETERILPNLEEWYITQKQLEKIKGISNGK